jgi:hypothetical protein
MGFYTSVRWAKLHFILGEVIYRLGEREPGTERFKEAVAVWEAILTVGSSELPSWIVRGARSSINMVRTEISWRLQKV